MYLLSRCPDKKYQEEYEEDEDEEIGK